MSTYVERYINAKYVLCPYDNNHKIPANRLPKHLITCEKRNKEVLITCPFNASHRLSKNEIEEHVMTCKDQSSIVFEQIMFVSKPLEDNSQSNGVKKEDNEEENWD